MQLASVISPILDLLYPRHCAACGVSIESEHGQICWDCRCTYDVIAEPFCVVCGDPPGGMVEHRYTCSLCLRQRPHFDMARSAVRYRGSVRAALHSFKYQYVTCLTEDFVPMLKACVETHHCNQLFDALTFVPLYGRKERERTFNQSRLLAKGLASALGLPSVNSLQRVRMTLSQTNLTAVQRRDNVKKAFRVRNQTWVEGRSLLLVDDVMTTGSTVSECSHVLKKAGAAEVHVVTVARG